MSPFIAGIFALGKRKNKLILSNMYETMKNTNTLTIFYFPQIYKRAYVIKLLKQIADMPI